MPLQCILLAENIRFVILSAAKNPLGRAPTTPTGRPRPGVGGRRACRPPVGRSAPDHGRGMPRPYAPWVVKGGFLAVVRNLRGLPLWADRVAARHAVPLRRFHRALPQWAQGGVAAEGREWGKPTPESALWTGSIPPRGHDPCCRMAIARNPVDRYNHLRPIIALAGIELIAEEVQGNGVGESTVGRCQATPPRADRAARCAARNSAPPHVPGPDYPRRGHPPLAEPAGHRLLPRVGGLSRRQCGGWQYDDALVERVQRSPMALCGPGHGRHDQSGGLELGGGLRQAVSDPGL